MTSPVGAFNRAFRVDIPAAPNPNYTGEHMPETIELERDDAPRTTSIPEPNSVLTHETFVTELPRTDEDDTHENTHEAGGTHEEGDTRPHVMAPELVFDATRREIGGWSEGTVLGAGGPANGGMRADGSAPWMTPGVPERGVAPGFNPGHDYTPRNAERTVPNFRQTPALRGHIEQYVETGTASQPPATQHRGPFAQPFNRIFGGRSQGTAEATRRVVMPPFGDQIQQADNSFERPPVGSEWVL
jgi:hypothetical protein